MRPVHPGEILKEELETRSLSANRRAQAIQVPANRISLVLKGQRGISADTALRLARYFGTSPQFWLNLQNGYDLKRAERENGKTIRKIKTVTA